jgi:hypothetical protein
MGFNRRGFLALRLRLRRRCADHSAGICRRELSGTGPVGSKMSEGEDRLVESDPGASSPVRFWLDALLLAAILLLSAWDILVYFLIPSL